MSIKKTSILALSVLLSYESFAAPTVLATTPRLGASSSVASTGRGKATTSVSIGGGLNKLTSNRGQSSFTPNSAPTDKQNELIENFQKEIQNVRDAVAEELQAQNDKIRELESVIEEKDEKIAELEESIDEKIESKGFVTAESVTSEISTAKQEAVRQATNAAVKEVNSMGFAKTATVQSDILTAKNAAIAQAKTEAVAEVNGMGFAKTATINSDILNAKNAAIEQATTAALAEVESKGFATNVSVQNLKAEITTERNAALKSYATSAQLAEGIDAAKSEITTERNAALKSYATSADVSSAVTAAKSEITNARNAALKSYATSADVSNAVTAAKTEAIAAANTAIAAESATRSAIVEKLATKEELQNLEVGVDEERLAGIIDGKLQAGDFATVTALNELSEKVTQNTQNITEEKGKIANLDARLAPGFVTPAALTTYKGEVAGTIATLATRDELGDYAKSSALTSLDAKVTKNTQDITAFQAEVDNISDTIAGNLLADTTFKEGVLEGLSTELTGLPARVTELDNRIDGLSATYATNEALNRVDGKFASYVEIDDVNNRFTALDGKFVKPETLTGYATKGELGDYAKAVDVEGLTTDLADLKQPTTLEGLLSGKFVKPTTLDTRINGLSAIYATTEALNTVDGKFANYVNGTDFDDRLSKYVKEDDFDSRLSNSTALDDIFVKQGEFSGLLSKDSKFSELNSKVTGLDTTVGTLRSSVDNMPATVIGKMRDDSTSDNYIGNWIDSKSKKPLVVTRYNVSEHTDDNNQPIIITQATLGTGVATLFGEKDATNLSKLSSNVSSALTKANAASADATSALTKANTASTDASSALTKANNATSNISSLTTRVTNAESSLANKVNLTDAVTKSSLTRDLYTKLNQLETCSESGGSLDNDTNNLKTLLNGTFTTCSTTGKDGGLL